GPIILLYVFFHLADLTWGWIDSDWQRGNPYGNLSNSLSTWWIAAIYVVANTALAIHLYHGIWSMFQSLGINNPRINSVRRPLAMSVAGLVLVGNLSFPLMVNLGVLDSDNVVAEYSSLGVGDPTGGNVTSSDAVVEVSR
ncbi:MAG: hypothetical protein GXP35_18055, partial [Actinobacteria bacterium]|nr:hypothetical protein [Actinomycetota bacterium]